MADTAASVVTVIAILRFSTILLILDSRIGTTFIVEDIDGASVLYQTLPSIVHVPSPLAFAEVICFFFTTSTARTLLRARSTPNQGQGTCCG